jgi:flagellar FliL protein
MAKNKDAESAEDGEAKGGKSKLKLIATIVPVVLLLVGGGVYFFVLAPKSDSSAPAAAACEEGAEDCETTSEDGAAPEPTSTYVPGATVEVEPVTINLAGGHYLKVGLLLQATADAGEEVPAGKAADALIAEFSGKTVDEISTEEGRNEAKEELLKTIKKMYEKKVYEIYYTSFVMN